MGTCCTGNKGESLRRHPPEFVNLVSSFRPVLFCMTVTADRQQIREVESHRRVINVLRSNVFDMVDRVRWYVLPALKADLTESARLLEV